MKNLSAPKPKLTPNLNKPEIAIYTQQAHKAELRPDFTSKLVHVLAFGTPKFYIVPYDKIKHELVKLSSIFDMKLGLRLNHFVLNHC